MKWEVGEGEKRDGWRSEEEIRREIVGEGRGGQKNKRKGSEKRNYVREGE